MLVPTQASGLHRFLVAASVAWSCLALGPASGQQQFIIGNPQTTLTFTKEAPAVGGDVWLDAIVTAAGTAITFDRSRSMWTLRARIDPSVSANSAYDLTIEPDDLGAPFVMIANGVGAAVGDKTLIATWIGTVPAVTGSGTADPSFTVTATWALDADEDEADARISATITNGTATTYRLWLARFPRLATNCLDTKDGQDDGSDALATGRIGGLLYGDPIGYVDPISGRGYIITGDPHHQNYVMSPDSVEPGYYSVPVGAYYDRTTGQGLYVSNDDDAGFMKGLYWYQDTSIGDGLLIHETIQFPADTFNATSYASPYAVQVAALDDMDWITAAHRYRSLYRTFPWYNGKSGTTQNTAVPTAMKSNPLFGWVTPDTFPYCVPTVADVQKVQNELSFFNSYLGMPFPMLLFNRFVVDPPSEVTAANQYVPASGAMGHVHNLAATAEAAGNRVAIHAMTEKLHIYSPSSNNCGFCSGTYCNNFDPALMGMNIENGIWQKPHTGPFFAPCPRGKGDPSGIGIDWPQWFASTSASFANLLGTTGGQGWPSPNPWAGWCFSKDHDHAPGFGNFFAQGWLDMLQATRNAVTTTTEFPTLQETSVAFFSQEVGVQNPWSIDWSLDLNNFLETGQAATWGRYFNSGIRRLPLLQMAVDNLRYGTVYFPATCSMPYTDLLSPSGPRDRLFEPFPAVSAALSCWSMGQRVLGHQGCVIVSNEQMVAPADLQNPGGDDAKIAAADMIAYFRGLTTFLQSSVLAPLMRFHTGALERTPDVTVTNATESFVLPYASTIMNHFPKLRAGINLIWNTAGLTNEPRDLDFASYQPIKHILAANALFTNWRVPVSPDENPTWLPRGMYRHHDGTQLALLMTNPWGAKQLDAASGAMPPMNPFTFDYANPPASSANVYTYTYTFDPAQYEGFPSTYRYATVVHDQNGAVVAISPFVTTTGPVNLVGNLGPFESVAWIFRP